MDCLACELICEAVEGTNPALPGWMAANKLAIRENAQRFHGGRYDYPMNCSKAEETIVSERIQAKMAYDGLGLEGGDDLRRSFSVRYNGQKVSEDARADFLAGFLLQITAPPPVPAQAIVHIHNFVANGNVAALHAAFPS